MTRRGGGRLSDRGGHGEIVSGDGFGHVVLFRFVDLNLVEVARALELGDEIGDGVDAAGFADDVEAVALAFQAGEPELVNADDSVGDHLEQFLSAGAILLQVFDDADLGLQGGFLRFEAVNFLLDYLQVGLDRKSVV